MGGTGGPLTMTPTSQDNTTLPSEMQTFFPEYRLEDLSLEKDRDLVVGRILATGDWDSVVWLWRKIGGVGFTQWILEHEGSGLDPRRLRFWEHVLRLPKERVDSWVKREKESVWGRRNP